MKAVMLSIKPKYCELIASGKKTIEVRKTRPKIETPFKCYIYCTKDKTPFLLPTYSKGNLTDSDIWQKGNGKVIGEFVCDKIDKIHIPTELIYEKEVTGFSERTLNILNQSCLSYDEIVNYSGCTLNNYDSRKDWLFAWYISDLVIYDKPKELSEFISFCPEYEKTKITEKCHKCKHWIINYLDQCFECACDGEKKLIRPPQSWCYVEEV